jgi:hypothetical protein
MPTPPHVANFRANLEEIRGLLAIHVRLTGVGPGRRRNVGVLNRAGIVLLVACWEAYVEDVAALAFEAMMEGARRPSVFPAKVLTRASRDLRKHVDERRVWQLAGDGWKRVLERHRTEILRKHVGGFNTPKPEQIDSLFEDLIGLRKLSSKWKWGRTSAVKASATLSKLVTTRGEIAHRVRAGAEVRKSDVLRARKFIDRLAWLTSNTISDYVVDRTRQRPWPTYAWGPRRRRSANTPA